MSSQVISDKGPSPYPVLPDINVTEKGINKALSNIYPHKA